MSWIVLWHTVLVCYVNSGENTWAAMSLDDQSEAFETLQLEEREMRKDGTLKSKAIGLYGAGATLGSTLEAMMGELPKEVKSRKKELESRRSQLKDDGLSNMDADAIIRKETDSVFKGESLSKVGHRCCRFSRKRELIYRYLFLEMRCCSQFLPVLMSCWWL